MKNSYRTKHLIFALKPIGRMIFSASVNMNYFQIGMPWFGFDRLWQMHGVRQEIPSESLGKAA